MSFCVFLGGGRQGKMVFRRGGTLVLEFARCGSRLQKTVLKNLLLRVKLPVSAVFFRVDCRYFVQFFACEYSEHSRCILLILSILVFKNIVKKRTSACKGACCCSFSKGRFTWIS